ncbi:hypothetical protein [Microbispora sp. NPDC049125]
MTWEPDGTVSRVRYAYPDGYTSNGMGRVTSGGMKAMRVAMRGRVNYR